MAFTLLKKFGGTRYDTFREQPEDRTPSPVASRSPSDITRSPLADMMSFSDDEETPSPASRQNAAQHARTLSDESATSRWAEVLTAPSARAPGARLRPRRPAPAVPETLESHLQRLGPDVASHRDHLARSILRRAAHEWEQPYPMPVSLDRMSVQSFKHVQMNDDVDARKALICTQGLYSAAGAAKHFWQMARNAVLEVYIHPRPDASDSGRSVYYPKAAAELERTNPALHETLAQIAATDFSQAGSVALVELLGQLAPPRP